MTHEKLTSSRASLYLNALYEPARVSVHPTNQSHPSIVSPRVLSACVRQQGTLQTHSKRLLICVVLSVSQEELCLLRTLQPGKNLIGAGYAM